MRKKNEADKGRYSVDVGGIIEHFDTIPMAADTAYKHALIGKKRATVYDRETAHSVVVIDFACDKRLQCSCCGATESPCWNCGR